MFRVRRSKLPLLASAVGAALPALSFAQNSATWTYLGLGNNGGPWAATWTDTSVTKPWSPNTTYPNAASANPLFPAAYPTGAGATLTINKTVTNGLGQVTLNLSGILVNSLNFYGAGSNTLAAPGNVNNVGYQILGSGGITIVQSAGTQVGTIDVSNIGNDGLGTPTTLPGMATLSVSLTQTSGILYKTGVGTLVLDGSNNFSGSGGIQVNDGILRITKSDALSGVPVISTGNTGGIELYGNAGSSATAGTAGTFTLLGATSTKYNGANGELAAMDTGVVGSNSTWGDASSFVVLTGLPSVGAGTHSTLTVASTFLDLGTNGLSKMGAGTVIVPGLQLNGPLNVAGGMLKVKPGGAGSINSNSAAGLTTATSLSMAAGAKIDLTNNAMIINYGNGPSPKTAILGLLNSGWDNYAWDGPGLQSSTAANDPNGLTALGMLDNADWGYSDLGNLHNIPANSIIIKYTYYGDADLSGHVDGTDIGQFITGFQQHLTGWDNGDFNYDGVVNGEDESLLITSFQQQGGVLSALPPAELAVLESIPGSSIYVPEPATFGCLGLATMGLLSMRKRRK